MFVTLQRPPPLTRARIGGEVLAFPVIVGLYVNLGEIADFLAGFAGLDLAGDDGLPKGAKFEPETPASRPATRPHPTREDPPADRAAPPRRRDAPAPPEPPPRGGNRR